MQAKYERPRWAIKYPWIYRADDPAMWDAFFDDEYEAWLMPQIADWVCTVCGRDQIRLAPFEWQSGRKPGGKGYAWIDTGGVCYKRHLTAHQQKRRQVRAWQRQQERLTRGL